MLIPGMTSSPSAWRSVADMPGYRFHYVQVKGFAGTKPEANAQGDVSAPVAGEIARYIKATGLERPAFIGHSMGGTMALMIAARHPDAVRSEEHTSELQSLMRISYAVFSLKNKNTT